MPNGKSRSAIGVVCLTGLMAPRHVRTVLELVCGTKRHEAQGTVGHKPVLLWCPFLASVVKNLLLPHKLTLRLPSGATPALQTALNGEMTGRLFVHGVLFGVARYVM